MRPALGLPLRLDRSESAFSTLLGQVRLSQAFHEHVINDPSGL